MVASYTIELMISLVYHRTVYPSPHHMNKKILTRVALLGAAALGVYAYTQIQQQQPPEFHIIALDVGQGDAELITFRDGQKMLVDCGPDKKILERLGAHLASTDRTIDYVLITHPHLDHYGGCIDVVKRYSVKHIIYNTAGPKTSSYWRSWEEAMKQSQAEIRIMNHADRWIIASTTLEFLAPDLSLNFTPKPSDVNDTSIVFRLLDGPTGQSVLFTGDMEEPLEKAVVGRYCSSTLPSAPPRSSSSTPRTAFSSTTPDGTLTSATSTPPCPALQAKMLKAGHHGSDTSSSKAFLEAVAPQVAVVSCGKNNKFHHPSLSTVRRMEKLGIKVLRTDQKGDILLQ